MPSGVREMYQDKVNIVTSSEENFVFSTNQKYDFIFSDADHLNAQKWFEHVYDNLLKEIIKKTETNRSKTGMDLNDFILTKFYLEEPQCREKFENGNMKEFVRWLYC
jgi:hypothetical protein